MIINYLRSTVLPTLVFDEEKGEWRATNDEGDECKIWVQKSVMSGAFGDHSPVIPQNKFFINESGEKILVEHEWFDGGDVHKINSLDLAQENGLPPSQRVMTFLNTLLAGDMIQMKINEGTGHTFIVDSVEETGIWIYDSNWEYDHTVRRHFISFSDLSNEVYKFTAYRVNEEF